MDAAFRKCTRSTTGHMKRNPNIVGAPTYPTLTSDNRQILSTIWIETKPSAVIQSHRCQRFAHTAANCSHKCVSPIMDQAPVRVPLTKTWHLAARIPACLTMAALPLHCGFFIKREGGKPKDKTASTETIEAAGWFQPTTSLKRFVQTGRTFFCCAISSL